MLKVFWGQEHVRLRTETSLPHPNLALQSSVPTTVSLSSIFSFFEYTYNTEDFSFHNVFCLVYHICHECQLPMSPYYRCTLSQASMLCWYCECVTGSSPTLASHVQDMRWLRPSHSVEILPGKGVKCWIATQSPNMLSGRQLPATDADLYRSVLDTRTPCLASANVRVLVGNRQLMVDEGIHLPRQDPPIWTANSALVIPRLTGSQWM